MSLLALVLMLPATASYQAPLDDATTQDGSAPDGSTPDGSAPDGGTGDGQSGTGEETPGPAPAPEAAEPGRSTDTEYLKVQIDRDGRPKAAWLKSWLRLRGPGKREVVDPGVFADLYTLHGTPKPRVDAEEGSVRWNVAVPSVGYKDLYYEGRLQRAGSLWMTPEGPKPLPVHVRIRYYAGDEGAEQELLDAAGRPNPAALEASDKPVRFKIVITLTNMTKRMEEVRYTDVQTKKEVVGVAPVYTPYVARVVDMRFPDGRFDQVRSNGDLTRGERETVVNWTRYLVPPDFPARQHAIVSGIIASGSRLPEIKVVAQPVYPPFDAASLNADGIQFQRGRRTFFYDVFNLFRDNLIALTGLFGLLHDAFGNLSIPILGPDKGNREAGSFEDPNQLWALWTLTKGLEQLDRAMNVIQNTVELARDASKGQLATLQQLRLLLGFSTDPAAASAVLDPITCFSDPEACGAEFEEAMLANSVWGDLKQAAQLCGDAGFASDDRPYLPEAPFVSTTLCPGNLVPFNVALLKLAILEHVLHALQKENHVLDTANLAGLAPLPAASGSGACTPGEDPQTPKGQTCGSYNKYLFIKFPFGLEELERGLHTLKTKGFEPLQQAIGNKDTPNSLIWALHVLTDGAEAQVDAFHQLGSTYRYIADSVQNFGIFGVETAKNILQWDLNAIDMETAIKAAEVKRAQELATFMGRPRDPDGEPAVGQLVLTYSTAALDERPKATDTTTGKAGVVLASGLIIATLLGFARFRWFLI